MRFSERPIRSANHHISLTSPRIRFPKRVVRLAARAGVRPSIDAGGVAEILNDDSMMLSHLRTCLYS